MAQMCTLSDFSRAGYYRSLSAAPRPVQEDLKLRDAMHRIATLKSPERLPQKVQVEGFLVVRIFYKRDLSRQRWYCIEMGRALLNG